MPQLYVPFVTPSFPQVSVTVTGLMLNDKVAIFLPLAGEPASNTNMVYCGQPALIAINKTFLIPDTEPRELVVRVRQVRYRPFEARCFAQRGCRHRILAEARAILRDSIEEELRQVFEEGQLRQAFEDVRDEAL